MRLSILPLAAMLPFAALAYDGNKMLCLVNQARENNGLPSLGMNSRLVDAAQDHCNDMANMNSLSHYGSDGSDPSTRITQAGYNWLAVAENVANGAKDVKTCFKQLMNSPEHKANILGSQYTQFGSAIAYGSDGTPFYTQDFASDGTQGNYPTCPGGDDDSSSSSSEDDNGSSGGGNSKYGRHSFGASMTLSAGGYTSDDGGSNSFFTFGGDSSDDSGNSFDTVGDYASDDGGSGSFTVGGDNTDDDYSGGGGDGSWTWFTT